MDIEDLAEGRRSDCEELYDIRISYIDNSGFEIVFENEIAVGRYLLSRSHAHETKL